MNIFRYRDALHTYLGVVTDKGELYRLPESNLMDLVAAARHNGSTTAAYVQSILQQATPISSTIDELQLLTPVDAPEVWAAGVTYQRSREARNYEATEGKLDSLTFYDKVYDADRPELFMKSTAQRTVGPNEEVCLRTDSKWQVPEAEIGLVLDESGAIIGYTIGNDMSCRDIEGENPLYLPQAKIWRRSCAIGPFVRLAETIDDPYSLSMACRVYRDGQLVVEEQANSKQLKRTFDELVSYLKKDNVLFAGTVLLTGTCLVPPNDFTLQSGDRIEIEIEGLGTLVNVAVYEHELAAEALR
ncbi:MULTISPECIES: fumarylacetoacetate hydrolase family protein [Paenibacillus]|uniref:fumarylacetoacetate hydrolase family protein n=1 Tax=Paenibacillus TaxID=44249 RepID=UPI00203A605A|nr:fumarylacetoacetate hydrolase family protein [Paenibacillus camelliae]MCM3632482.1 fumarylacetoacetate hydrolase family protein [Paenibacillus camelliae]